MKTLNVTLEPTSPRVAGQLGVADAVMRIAACQLPDVRKDINRALSMVATYTADAERQGAALICFPEGFLQGYDLSPEYVPWVTRKAADFVSLVVGLQVESDEGNKLIRSRREVHHCYAEAQKRRSAEAQKRRSAEAQKRRSAEQSAAANGLSGSILQDEEQNACH